MSAPSTAAMFESLWANRGPSKGPRLRFELGGEIYKNTRAPIPRFLQAHRRASAIADFLFDDVCIGIVAWSKDESGGNLSNGSSGFAALAATGFRASICDTWEHYLYGKGESSIHSLRSYDLTREKCQRDVLLWHPIAREMGIEPMVNIVSFLLHPARQLLLHVYDDRGMDLTAADPRELLAAYERFNEWLLDYDRARMAQIF